MYQATSPVERSSPAQIQSSSPVAHTPNGTEFTEISPYLLRHQSKAVGKIAVPDIFANDPPKFLNEYDNGEVQLLGSRYLLVHVLAPQLNGPETSLQLVEAVMKRSNADDSPFHKCVPLDSARGVRIRFDSARDAARGKSIFEEAGFPITFISQNDFAAAKFQDPVSANEFEAQIKLVAQPAHTTSAKTPAQMIKDAYVLCSSFGIVRETQILIQQKFPIILRIEFDSIDAANRAVQQFKLNPVWGIGANGDQEIGTFNAFEWSQTSAVSSSASSPHRSQQGSILPFVSRRHPNDQHNRVRRERIVDGSDIRTTVMLRNIPNKMDFLTLKELLDKFCFGTFDFVYLRIDFRTGCNVGYAFINFSDVEGMLSMLDHIEHRHWIGFRSQKAAEVSYATIQGKEALVSKFRNSSVMQETPYCRPRIYFSNDDVAQAFENTFRIGTEMRFPSPDNLAKLQRSMDSARSTGLYPPNGAGTLDHRTRQGMYDNGNPRDRFAGFATLSPELKVAIENGYACANSFVRVNFANIPRDFVEKFLAHQAWTAPTPGVIGQPLPQYPRQQFNRVFPAHTMEPSYRRLG